MSRAHLSTNPATLYLKQVVAITTLDGNRHHRPLQVCQFTHSHTGWFTHAVYSCRSSPRRTRLPGLTCWIIFGGKCPRSQPASRLARPGTVPSCPALSQTSLGDARDVLTCTCLQNRNIKVPVGYKPNLRAILKHHGDPEGMFHTSGADADALAPGGSGSNAAPLTDDTTPANGEVEWSCVTDQEQAIKAGIAQSEMATSIVQIDCALHLKWGAWAAPHTPHTCPNPHVPVPIPILAVSCCVGVCSHFPPHRGTEQEAVWF